ncbi:MAG TPA: cupin domain-containing protein [Rhodothermia bacterium]|nr:cupin domain-containing protein [Rhodothermia bacterium]
MNGFTDRDHEMPSIGLDAGPAVDLAGLVEYADGAIVSRILLRTDGGNVTLFAFDEGQELSEHTTKFDALISLVDGSADIVVAGTDHKVETGQVILLPANVPHAVRAVGRFKMVLTMLK